METFGCHNCSYSCVLIVNNEADIHPVVCPFRMLPHWRKWEWGKEEKEEELLGANVYHNYKIVCPYCEHEYYVSYKPKKKKVLCSYCDRKYEVPEVV